MELVEIGKIINTFGIKGDLKIASSTDFGEQRFAPGSHILVKTPREYLDFEISKHYIHKGFDMIAVKGYTDINEVEKYKDVFVMHLRILLCYLKACIIFLILWIVKFIIMVLILVR